jgi:hypothetical protein
VTPKRAPLIRWTAFAAGCLIAASVVHGGKLPEGRAATGVTLEVSSHASAELGVSPPGNPFLETRELMPGGAPSTGRLELSNYTGRKLAVGARLQSGDRDLDSLVQVALTVDRRSVFQGSLSELRSRVTASFVLGPAQRRRLGLRVWLPRSVKHDFQGRSAQLKLAIGPAAQGG